MPLMVRFFQEQSVCPLWLSFSKSKVFVRLLKNKNKGSASPMSYRDMKVLTEQLRALGYPQLVSMETFRTPNFNVMANIIYWLVNRHGASKAQISLNTRNLYRSDGYAVKELLKISSLLKNAKDAPSYSDSKIVGVAPLEFGSKLVQIKHCKTLASEITEKGAELYDLLGQELECREIRSKAISQPFELDDIEKIVLSTTAAIKEKLKATTEAYENLQADEANLVSKIEKKKLEFERAEKRFKSLQGVRPAYMDEYERIEKELVMIYQSYLEKFRNLSFLEQQLDEYNREEQFKFDETEDSLKKMQSRLREEELNLLRGEKEASLMTQRPNRPVGASTRGRGSNGTIRDPLGSDDIVFSSKDNNDDQDGLSLGSLDSTSSEDQGNDNDSSDFVVNQKSQKVSMAQSNQKKTQIILSDDDESLEIASGDDDDNDF